MRFSIIIPVYNASRYLRECLDSIFTQTYRDFEVIAVDDGSEDDSLSICREYGQKHPELKVIAQENRGPFYARREGAKNAAGEYFVFVDSDDMLARDALEIIGNAIDEARPDMLVFGISRYADGVLYPSSAQLADSSCPVDKSLICSSLLTMKLESGLCAKAYAAEVFDFDREYEYIKGFIVGEDLLQNLPLIGAAKSFYYVKKPLYYYRTTTDSLTRGYKPEMISSLMLVNSALDKYASIWGREYEPLFAYRYIYDCYDIVRYSSNSRSFGEIDNNLDKLWAEDVFEVYRAKYALADRKMLDIRARIVCRMLCNKRRTLIKLHICAAIYFGSRLKAALRRLGLLSSKALF